MQKRVFVTGYGIISGIGCGEEESFLALKERRSAIGVVSFLNTALQHFPVAEVKNSTEDLIRMAEIPVATYSRTFLLGLIAARQAIKMSGCEPFLSEMALVGSTTVGGMDLNERCYKDLIRGNIGNIDKLHSLECADCAERIAHFLGIKSNVMTISTACSSSANAIIVGTRMIRNGLVDRVLVGGMDSLSRFSLNGFNSLEIISPTGCHPFDRDRDGVTPGEGAAFLVLESESVVSNRLVYGEIKGYSNHNEAFHQTASAPDGTGAIMTIAGALKKAEIHPEEVDYINAHGTGTQVNDLSEGNAICAVFGKNIPSVSSTKGYTGHTLAAAGIIETVFSLWAIKHQVVFPNLRFENAMEELTFLPEIQMKTHKVRNVLSNSFGFGGCNSTLIISAV